LGNLLSFVFQAYHKSRSSSVQIARIIAVTVVVCSIILGSFLLASAYVNANSSCRQLEQELELLGEAADRFQPPLQPEALIQEEPLPSKRHSDHYPTEEPPKNTKELETNSIDNSDADSDDTSENSSGESGEPEKPHLRMPVQMDMDDLVASLLEKNQKSKMNCIVEKKKAEEFVDHQPKTIRLPFGVNITTNPRFEKISGERMVIVCESGSMQRAEPPRQSRPEQEDSEEDIDGHDEQQDTIMIQPVMIPIPQSPFRTHMPQQQMPMVQMVHQQMAPEGRPMNLPAHLLAIEGMRPPASPVMPPQVQRISRIQIQARPQLMEEPQMQVHQLPPQMPPQMQQSAEFPPNPILRHIVQQIIAQKIMESQRAREMQMREEQQQQQQQPQQQQQQQQPQVELEEERPHRFQMPDGQVAQNMMGQRIPIPEEVLTQLNRLPNRDVIVAVQETSPEESEEDDQSSSSSSEQQQQQQQQQQEVRFVQQEQRQSAAEVNGRQTFAPVDIPVAMMPRMRMGRQQMLEEEQQQHVEEARPHFVQPRSV
ncbi:unnamed protein product, partial [Phaedon cochleariae]